MLRIITLLVLDPYLTPGVTTPALITTGLLIVTVEPLYVERLDEKVLERNWAWQLVVTRVKLIKVTNAPDFILLITEFVILF